MLGVGGFLNTLSPHPYHHLSTPYSSRMTGKYATRFQSNSPKLAFKAIKARKLLSRFIISRRVRGTTAGNSILGLLRKNGGWACGLHVDSRCSRSGPGLGLPLGEGSSEALCLSSQDWFSSNLSCNNSCLGWSMSHHWICNPLKDQVCQLP